MFSKHILSFIILGFCLAATTCYAWDEEDLFDPADSLYNRVGYGSPCNDTDRNQLGCDFKFSCYNGTCQCRHPEASIYTAGNSQPCKIKAGNRCIDKYENYNGQIRTEFVCVDNAKCLPPGFCSCLPEFHMVDDGTCVRQGDIGETCNSDVDCNTEKHLACGEINGRKICICPCNPDPSILKNRCVIYLFRDCSSDGVKCIRNANCVDGVCECKSGYMESETGFCQINGFSTFNETCETIDDCGSDDNGIALICNSNGRCDCSGSRPVYSTRGYYKRGACVQVFGGKCSYNEDCDFNFECNRRSDRCLCKDLYSVNYDGNCERNL